MCRRLKKIKMNDFLESLNLRGRLIGDLAMKIGVPQ